MRSFFAIALPAALSLASAGCDECASAGTLDASAPDAGAPAASASVRAPAASASASAEKPPLQLLKFVFTSEVKNKEPVDKLDRAQPGQRVWVHLTLRNRGDARPVSVVFRVNNEQRSKVELKVESSWSFRTWAYNTLRSGDLAGELAVEVRDDTGSILTMARLPIKAADAARPLPD